VQQQVQQVRQEKTDLESKLSGVEQEKAALSQEKEKLAGQVNGAQARAKSESAKSQLLQSSLDAMTKEKQALQVQKTELDQRFAELTTKQASTERELVLTRAQKAKSESLVMARDQQVASCEDKNGKLYLHGRNLIEQCRDRSATDILLRLEPVTGIKRVAIENVLEEYRDKLDSQKFVGAEPLVEVTAR
jgi:chromosome segregation ATPase